MIHLFDAFSVNTETLELHGAAGLVDIEPQVFRLLLALIDNGGRVLSKNDLVDLVWHGRAVSDTAITSRIKSLRKALGDSGKTQRYIKTVHGRGYRFIGKLQDGVGIEELAAATPLSPSTAQEPGDPEHCERPSERPAILVLPFRSLNPVVELPVLPEGFAHDLIMGLSRLHWLRVISRLSAFQFDGEQHDHRQIREKTGARYCLAGSVEKLGPALSLTIELSDLETDSILWVERVNGRLDDIHRMRADITDRASSTLEVKISAHQAQLAMMESPENLDAWSSYHLGIRHMYRFNANDNGVAVEHFKRAVQLEPGFARAHAGLSFSQFQNAFNQYPGSDRKSATLESRRSAERSIELDNLDPMANFVMGRSHWLNADAAASLPWIERALAVNPNFAQGYYSHGLALVMAGRPEGAFEDSVQALALSPLDPFVYGFHGIRAFYYLASGNYERARTWAVSAAHQPGAIVVMDLIAAAADALAGNLEQAEKWIDRAKRRNSNVSQAFFFQALPFCEGETRSRIATALSSCGLS